ncbi:MAG: hypothetical protein K8R87_08125 [Verrucomicrobia bacterium]|nr:hypothetical protein [Verrucomicrobiota bacterium]
MSELNEEIKLRELNNCLVKLEVVAPQRVLEMANRLVTALQLVKMKHCEARFEIQRCESKLKAIEADMDIFEARAKELAAKILELQDRGLEGGVECVHLTESAVRIHAERERLANESKIAVADKLEQINKTRICIADDLAVLLDQLAALICEIRLGLELSTDKNRLLEFYRENLNNESPSVEEFHRVAIESIRNMIAKPQA